MNDETLEVERTTLMRVKRSGDGFEMELCADGSITIRELLAGDYVGGIRPEDLARFLDLIRAGGTNGND